MREGVLDAALRRGLDVFVSAVLLVALAPVLVALAVAVRWDSPGPVLFVQTRVGRGGRTFRLHKLRTMVADAPRRGPLVTAAADPRVTRVGRWLRRTKCDELPQLWDVLRGAMSLVGPRPEVPEWVLRWTPAQRRVLHARPGITDPAALAFVDEEALLAAAPDPQRFYGEVVAPAKLALSADYLARRTVLRDVGVLLRTAGRLAGVTRGVPPPVAWPTAAPEPAPRREAIR